MATRPFRIVVCILVRRNAMISKLCRTAACYLCQSDQRCQQGAAKSISHDCIMWEESTQMLGVDQERPVSSQPVPDLFATVDVFIPAMRSFADITTQATAFAGCHTQA